MQKWSVFMQISRKNSDLNFVLMRIFLQKNYLFRMNAHFVQNWFRIDMKMMRKFVQKSHFVQNHATVAQEN